MCSGNTATPSAAGISISCFNLDTMMTSAPACVVTLLRGDREEILWHGVRLFYTSDAELKWMNECVAGCSESQAPLSRHTGPTETRVQSQQSNYHLCKQMRTILESRNPSYVCMYNQIHHPLDIKAYRRAWSKKRSSWEAFLLENKSSHSTRSHRTINLNVSPLLFGFFTRLPYRGGPRAQALWGHRVCWLSWRSSAQVA